MSTVREAAIEAGWAALEAADADDGSIVTLGDVAAVVDAVEPIIRADTMERIRAKEGDWLERVRDEVEAEVRERIAQEIEADEREFDTASWVAARARYAAIARGGAQSPAQPPPTVTTTTVSTDVRDTPRSIYDRTR